MELNRSIKKKKTDDSVNLECLMLVGAAYIISYIPILNIPFTWIMTFFHEISHGLGALITGGSVERIHLHLMGSGLCYTSGGIQFIVLQSGYIGVVIWGIVIYKMACNINQKTTNIFAIFIAGLIVVSALLYGRDIITWIILSILFGIFVSIIKMQNIYSINLSLKLIGIFVLLDALRAPLYLIDGRHDGDGAKLSDLTGILEIFWVFMWLAIGICGVLYIWKSEK